MDAKILGEWPAFPASGLSGSFSGMTLRQHYAGLALKGMLAHPTRYKPRPGAPENWHDAIAEEAGQLADALLQQMAKEPAPEARVSETTPREAGLDPLYNEALGVVIKSGQASTAVLQRRLRIGYGRAARLLELLEEREIIGPANGNEPRKLLHPC